MKPEQRRRVDVKMSIAGFIYSVIMNSFCGSFIYSEIQNHLLANRKKKKKTTFFSPPANQTSLFHAIWRRSIKVYNTREIGSTQIAITHSLYSKAHGHRWAKGQCNAPHLCSRSPMLSRDKKTAQLLLVMGSLSEATPLTHKIPLVPPKRLWNNQGVLFASCYSFTFY